MADKDYTYSLKEVIEKNFQELKTDMRAGFSEIKLDMKEVRQTAEDALKSATAANRRLDSYDKNIWLIWGAIVLGFVKMAFDYFTRS